MTVYCIIRNRDNYIIYVGISKNMKQRFSNLKAGWKSTNDTHKLHKYIRQCNNDVSMIPIQTTEKAQFPLWVESWYISFIISLGFDLANSRQSHTRPFKEAYKQNPLEQLRKE